MTDIEVYKILVDTVNIISRTKYVKYFAIKGGLVLVTKMFEHNREDMFRRTTDVDIHCNSKEIWESFCRNCEGILNENRQGLVYRLIKRRADTKGLDTSDSLQFNVQTTTGESTVIKMDMNIKSNDSIQVQFDINLNMYTYNELTMLADKLVVVSSQSVYRRIKDLYDLCVLASMYNFRLSDISSILMQKHNRKFTDLTNMLVPQNFGELSHAYDKYKGIVNKQTFGIVLNLAQQFLYPIYTNYSKDAVWDCEHTMWR